MRLDTLRMIVGFSLIGSHLITFSMILLGTPKLFMSEKIELSLLLSPIFAVYVAAIVKRFTTPDPNYDSTPTHPALRILSIGASTLFSAAVPIVLYQFIVGNIATFADLKTTLGIVETALGVYTGAVIDRLFGGSAKGEHQGAPEANA